MRNLGEGFEFGNLFLHASFGGAGLIEFLELEEGEPYRSLKQDVEDHLLKMITKNPANKSVSMVYNGYLSRISTSVIDPQPLEASDVEALDEQTYHRKRSSRLFDYLYPIRSHNSSICTEAFSESRSCPCSFSPNGSIRPIT